MPESLDANYSRALRAGVVVREIGGQDKKQSSSEVTYLRAIAISVWKFGGSSSRSTVAMSMSLKPALSRKS
jgi:hypothetical protein